MRDLDRGNSDLTHPLHATQRLGIGGEQPGDAAEFGEQSLGQRLGILTRNRRRQQIFDQLVIEQRLAALLEQPLAQPCAVAAMILIGRVHRDRD